MRSLLGSSFGIDTPGRKRKGGEGSKIVQRKKLGWDAVPRRASADPMGTDPSELQGGGCAFIVSP